MTKTIEELFQLKAVEIVKLEPTDHLVKAIWVHQHKLDANGNLLRIKSRLCPQGFRYRPHIDFLTTLHLMHHMYRQLISV
jgi:hypothetical protein